MTHRFCRIVRKVCSGRKGCPERVIFVEVVSSGGKRPIVAPAEARVRRKEFEAAKEWAHTRYGKACKKLAE
jgi:hypothetical protein